MKMQSNLSFDNQHEKKRALRTFSRLLSSISVMGVMPMLHFLLR